MAAREFLYQDIPAHYTWQDGRKEWRKRKQNAAGQLALGRVANVSPRDSETYHLRLLLLNIPGATSFEYLHTVDGVVYQTYKEAAFARGVIIDDQEWRRCMEEAAQYMMPFQLRSLFVILLIHCDVLRPSELWEEFRMAMNEDFRRQGHNEESADTLALLEIRGELETNGMSCAQKGLPEPLLLAEIIQEQLENVEVYANRGQDLLRMLNQDQRAAADDIFAAVNQNDSTVPNCFFVDGPGGTGKVFCSFLDFEGLSVPYSFLGKTFLHTALINVLRGDGKHVSAVAWTGIAAI